MVIHIKKDILFFVADILFIFWLLYDITKSESKSLFYIVFLFLFIIVAVIFRIFKESNESKKLNIFQNIAGWEKVLYVLGITLFVLKSPIARELTINQYVGYYNDYILIINTFILSLGAFILSLRIKELLIKIKIFKNKKLSRD